MEPSDAAFAPCVPDVGARTRIYDPSVGESEPWYYNDHTFIRGADGTWHVFAITHPEPGNPDDERALGHATSPSLTGGPWVKQRAPLTVDESLGETVLWAPYVMEHQGSYYMFYCAGGEPEAFQMRLARSTDLYTWTRYPEVLFEDGAFARDPYVMRVGSQWVMYYTATSSPSGGNFIVAYRTSDDLEHWGPRHVAFTDPMQGSGGGDTESPYVVQRPEGYYLFLSLRGEYVATDVFFSRDPFSFEQDALAHLPAHAAEVVRDSDGSWYLSHCGWSQGGLYLAPLRWSCSP